MTNYKQSPEDNEILWAFDDGKGNCKGKNGFTVCNMEKPRILQFYCFVHYFRYFAIIIRELKRKDPDFFRNQDLQNLVDDIGLEPMTFRTSSGCSSQLS